MSEMARYDKRGGIEAMNEELHRLRAERDRYRAALERIADCPYCGMEITVRFCPANAMTFDVEQTFSRVPMRGESIVYDDKRYVVVEIDWEDGEPFVIAHGADRPRARAAIGAPWCKWCLQDEINRIRNA